MGHRTDVATASVVVVQLSDLAFSRNALNQQGMDFSRCGMH